MFFATSIPNVVVFISNPPLYLVNEWLFLVEIPLILPHPRLFEKRAGSIPLLQPDNFPTDGILDQFRAGMQPELLHQVRSVCLDGLRLNRQGRRNLFSRASLRQQPQDLSLPRGELLIGGLGLLL